ncbi:MAG: DUF3830 family protein [Alphaproteobacteria bacterium]|nr:DUF3830 family protein [Alphaproteobacteria bacterium]
MAGKDEAMLILSAEGVAVEIGLDVATAPRTIAALLAALPLKVDLHCAKIAGDQILWPVPVLQPLESARDIQGAAPGAFIYYPKRQFLEIMFGPLQEESANVTILGGARGDLSALKRLGETVQADHGWRIVWGELSAKPGDWQKALPAAGDAKLSASCSTARKLRKTAWQAVPAEFERLRARRGVMIPLGPLFYAESETRKLHENLWLLRDEREARFKSEAAALLLRGAADMLEGFLGLHDTAKGLSTMADAIGKEPSDAAALLDEIILYVGRLSHWLDLYFPWRKLNAVAEAAADGKR